MSAFAQKQTLYERPNPAPNKTVSNVPFGDKAIKEALLLPLQTRFQRLFLWHADGVEAAVDMVGFART